MNSFNFINKNFNQIAGAMDGEAVAMLIIGLSLIIVGIIFIIFACPKGEIKR